MVQKRRGGGDDDEGSGPLSSSVNTKYLSDPKLKAGKEQTLGKMDRMKGPSNKEIKQERKVDIARRLAKEQDQVSWKKQLGTIAAVLLLCGAGLAQFVMTVYGFIQGNGVVNLDVKDTAQLKAVLFGGEPWLVYCVNNETASQRLPRVLEESANSLRSSLGVKSGVMSCWDPTESGRSVAQRFKLNLKPPMSFVVANGNKPRLINLLGISKPEELEKKIKPALKIDTYRIDSLKKWPSLCTTRKSCVVIGHKNQAQRDFALSIFKPLLESHRATKVVTLDTSFWQLKLGEAVLTTRSAKAKGKSAEVLCLSRDEGAADGNATHSGVFLQDLDASSADQFLQACEARTGLVKLEAPPRINARPSKPRKVTPPSPSPRPPPSPQPRDADKGNVDRVGSRKALENEEALFEAVDDEEGEEEQGGDDEEEDGEEVEL